MSAHSLKNGVREHGKPGGETAWKHRQYDRGCCDLKPQTAHDVETGAWDFSPDLPTITKLGIEVFDPDIATAPIIAASFGGRNDEFGGSIFLKGGKRLLIAA